MQDVMNCILKKGEIPEKDEILKLIEESPSVLDGSLHLLGKNLGPRNEPPWEFLGVREDKRLVLIAVETRVTDKMLFKLLRNLDWAWENLETFASIYASYGIASTHLPTVLLLAPSYPPFFRKCLNYLTYRLELNLFTYTCIASEQGRGLLVEPDERKPGNGGLGLKTDRGRGAAGGAFPKNVKISTEEIMEFLQ